jgi:hypothetical protein
MFKRRAAPSQPAAGDKGGGSDDDDTVWVQQLERKEKGFLKRSEKDWYYLKEGCLRRCAKGSKAPGPDDKVVCRLWLSTVKVESGVRNTFRVVTHTGKDFLYTAASPALYKEWSERLNASIEQALANQLQSNSPEQHSEHSDRIDLVRQANPTCADCGAVRTITQYIIGWRAMAGMAPTTTVVRGLRGWFRETLCGSFCLA